MRRRAFLILGSCALAFLVGACVLVLWLGSSAGLRFLLQTAEQKLTRSSVAHLHFSEVRGNLWSGFEIRDLQVRWERPSVRVDLDLSDLRLDYGISLWARRLEVHECVVQGHRWSIDLAPALPPGENLSESSKGETAPSPSWQERLTELPFQIVVDHFELALGSVLLEKRSTPNPANPLEGATKLSLDVRDLEWSGNFKALSGQLDLKNNLSFGEGSHFQWAGKDTQFRSDLLLHTSLGFSIRKASPHWTLRWTPLDLQVQLRHSELVGAADRRGFESAELRLQSVEDERTVGIRYAVAIKNFRGPPFAKALDAQLDGEVATPAQNLGERILQGQNLRSLSGQQSLRVLNHVLADWDWEAERDEKGLWALKGNIKFNLQHSVLAFIPQLKSWEKSAPRGTLNFRVTEEISDHWIANTNLVVPQQIVKGFREPIFLALDSETRFTSSKSEFIWNGHLDAKNTPWGPWHLDSELRFGKGPSGEEFETSGTSHLFLPDLAGNHFSQPLEIQHEVRGGGDQTVAHLKAQLPSVQMRGGMIWHHNELSADIELSRSLGRKKFSNLLLSLDNAMWSATGNLEENPFNHDIQGEITTVLDWKNPYEVRPQTFLQGQVRWPTSVRYSSSKELSLGGALEFLNFRYQSPQAALEGINGDLPINERLQISPFGFSSLITENPFERVQFEQVRPTLRDKGSLQIEKIHWQERTYGPLVGFLSLDQNRFFIHEMNLEVGAGQVYGELFMDVSPRHYQGGFLGRISNLDLRRILPQKFTERQGSEPDILSARAGLVLNVDRSSLTGRIDVTELGSTPLVSLINTLDPEYRSEKFNKIRGLLKVGAPTGISAAFENGYMDLQADLSILGIENHQSVRAIPISSLISKSLSGILVKRE